MFVITFNIAAEFRGPVSLVRCRRVRKSAVGVRMPEASMHEDNFPALCKDEVWATGELMVV